MIPIQQKNSSQSLAGDLVASGAVLRPVLDEQDVAAALRTSVAEVYELHRAQGLPLALIGGRRLISRVAFISWLDSQVVRP